MFTKGMTTLSFEQLGTIKPHKNPATVDNVVELLVQGPWTTKSNGQLDKLFELGFEHLFHGGYLDYDATELSYLPKNIRGLRSYTVHKLNITQENGKPNIGGDEYHRIRKELLFVLEGAAMIELEDVYGKKREVQITPRKGLYIQPFILHTYRITADNTRLLVIANTLFDANDDRTKDTYPAAVFRELQKHYRF